MFGRELICPCDIIPRFSFKYWAPRCPVQYVEWVTHTIKLTYEFVNQNLQRAAMRQKKNHDRGVKPRTFEAGAFVWRWYPSRAGLKLGLWWTGPFVGKTKTYRCTVSNSEKSKSKNPCSTCGPFKTLSWRKCL